MARSSSLKASSSSAAIGAGARASQAERPAAMIKRRPRRGLRPTASASLVGIGEEGGRSGEPTALKRHQKKKTKHGGDEWRGCRAPCKACCPSTPSQSTQARSQGRRARSSTDRASPQPAGPPARGRALLTPVCVPQEEWRQRAGARYMRRWAGVMARRWPRAVPQRGSSTHRQAQGSPEGGQSPTPTPAASPRLCAPQDDHQHRAGR